MPGSLVFADYGWGPIDAPSYLCADVLASLNARFNSGGNYFYKCSSGYGSVSVNDRVYVLNEPGSSVWWVTVESLFPLTNTESDMIVNCNVSPCVVSHDLQSPFNLSLSDGGAIAGSILLVWAAAYGIRMVIKALRSDESVISDD